MAVIAEGAADELQRRGRIAKMFQHVTYFEVLQRGLKVMDTTAISLCMDNRLPIIVYNLKKKGSLKQILMGRKVGTMVEE